MRNLLKYKTQNLICITGLAAGILCFTFCIYCTRFIHNYNKCFDHSDRIVSLQLQSISKGYLYLGTADFVEQLTMLDVPSMESVTRVSLVREFHVNPYNLISIEIDTAFNSVFGMDVIAGSWEGAVKQQNSLIISKSSAERIFGNATEVIGKTMIQDKGGDVYTVAAVIEDIPLNNSLNFMQHIDLFRLNDSDGKLHLGGDVYALLGETIKPADFEKDLKDVGFVYKYNGEDCKIFAKYPQVWESFVLISWITLAIGVLIIVIALINFFNFQVSLFNTRTSEYSIRKVFGSNRKQLFMQLYVQVAVILLLTSLLLLSLIEMFGQEIRLNLDIAEMEMNFSRDLLVRHALQYIVFLLLASTIICWFISRRLYRISVNRGIALNKGGGSVVGRNIMLWWQLFITWIFTGLVAALIMQFQTSTGNIYSSLTTKQKNEILSIPMDWSFMDNSAKEILVEKFGQHSGVIDVMCTSGSLVRGNSGYMYINWKGIGEQDQMMTSVLYVPDNFISFMNIPLLQGSMPVTEKDVLADRRFEQKAQTDVVGKNAYFRKDYYTVCGLVEEYKYSNYEGGAMSYGVMFVPKKLETVGHCYLKCHPQRVNDVRKWVIGILDQELTQSVDYSVGTLLDDINDAQGLENFLSKVFVFFAAVCIILTLLGVYSSISFDVVRRQKEVALRKINGAGKLQIAWVFIRLYSILLCTSAAAAFPLLYVAFGYWKQIYDRFFEYGASFWIILFVTITAIVAVTISWKVKSIVNLNPADAIKRS